MLAQQIQRNKEYAEAAPTATVHLESTLQLPAEGVYHPLTGKTKAGRGSGYSSRTPALTNPGFHPTTEMPLAGNPSSSVVAKVAQATYLSKLPESTGPTSMMGGNPILGLDVRPVPVSKITLGPIARSTLASASPATGLVPIQSKFVPSSPPVNRITSQGPRAGATNKAHHAWLTILLVAGAVGAVYYWR